MGLEEEQYSVIFLVLLNVSLNTAVFCNTTPFRFVESIDVSEGPAHQHYSNRSPTLTTGRAISQ
jgi:hypothetical protein